MSDTNKRTRSRQVKIALGAGAFVLIVFGAGAYLVDNQGGIRTTTPKERPVRIQPPGTIDDRDAWRGQQAAMGLDLEKRVRELQAQVKRLQGNEGKGGDGSEMAQTIAQMQAELAHLRAQMAPPKNTSEEPERPASTVTRLNDPIMPPATSVPAGPPVPPPPPPSRIEVAVFAPPIDASNKDKPAGKKEEDIQFIPNASFGRAYMLNGVYAPTGGQAQNNPVPVFFELMDPLNLANGYRLDYRKCRVLGTAWGNLSAERAEVRLENMICIIDGEPVDIPLRGTVMDNGIPGLAGQIVDKTGRAIALGTFAGIAAGIGKAFGQTGVTTGVSPLGATQVVDPDKVVRFGIGDGVSHGMDRIVDTFLDAADKLFPVVEVQGGKVIEIAITASAKYKGRSKFLDEARGLLRRAGTLN